MFGAMAGPRRIGSEQIKWAKHLETLMRAGRSETGLSRHTGRTRLLLRTTTPDISRTFIGPVTAQIERLTHHGYSPPNVNDSIASYCDALTAYYPTAKFSLQDLSNISPLVARSVYQTRPVLLDHISTTFVRLMARRSANWAVQGSLPSEFVKIVTSFGLTSHAHQSLVYDAAARYIISVQDTIRLAKPTLSQSDRDNTHSRNNNDRDSSNNKPATDHNKHRKHDAPRQRQNRTDKPAPASYQSATVEDVVALVHAFSKSTEHKPIAAMEVLAQILCKCDLTSLNPKNIHMCYAAFANTSHLPADNSTSYFPKIRARCIEAGKRLSGEAGLRMVGVANFHNLVDDVSQMLGSALPRFKLTEGFLVRIWDFGCSKDLTVQQLELLRVEFRTRLQARDDDAAAALLLFVTRRQRHAIAADIIAEIQRRGDPKLLSVLLLSSAAHLTANAPAASNSSVDTTSVYDAIADHPKLRANRLSAIPLYHAATALAHVHHPQTCRVAADTVAAALATEQIYYPSMITSMLRATRFYSPELIHKLVQHTDAAPFLVEALSNVLHVSGMFSIPIQLPERVYTTFRSEIADNSRDPNFATHFRSFIKTAHAFMSLNTHDTSLWDSVVTFFERGIEHDNRERRSVLMTISSAVRTYLEQSHVPETQALANRIRYSEEALSVVLLQGSRVLDPPLEAVDRVAREFLAAEHPDCSLDDIVHEHFCPASATLSQIALPSRKVIVEVSTPQMSAINMPELALSRVLLKLRRLRAAGWTVHHLRGEEADGSLRLAGKWTDTLTSIDQCLLQVSVQEAKAGNENK